MGFENQTYEKKRIFAKHSQNKNPTNRQTKAGQNSPLGRSDQHRQNATKQRKAGTRQQKQKLAPGNGSQKPNPSRREFLPSIFGNRSPTSMQKHWQNATEKHKAATRQQERERKRISKPSLRRGEFLPSIFGKRNPTNTQKHWQNTTEQRKAATRQQKQKLAPENGLQKPNSRT